MSRRRPTNEEIINAIKESMVGYHFVVQFEDIRYRTQLRLKTVARSARDWMLEALTAPAQDDLVVLYSDDNKYANRVVRTESGDYSYYGDLREGVHLMLRLDRRGARTDSGNDAVRNVTWIMHKSILDGYIAELLKQEQEKQAERSKEKAAEDASTEGIIGTELSMMRGMLVAAGITPDDKTLTAWALRVDKGEGKTARRARVVVELNAKQLIQFSKWLTTRNVQPVTPELLAKMGES